MRKLDDTGLFTTESALLTLGYAESLKVHAATAKGASDHVSPAPTAGITGDVSRLDRT